jgi:phospholipase D1/2
MALHADANRDESGKRGRSRARALVRLAALPAVVVIGALVAWKMGYFEMDSRRELFDRVQRLRQMPGIEPAFAAGVVLVVCLCLPLTVTTILGGALFGPWLGASLSWGGAIAGTVVAYLLSNRIAQRPMRRLFGDHSMLRQLREHDDVVSLFRLRVLPVAPFGVLDYVSGLAGVSLRRLLVATALGSTLNVAAYSFVGHALFEGLASQRETSRWSVTIAVGLTAAMLGLSLLPRLTRGRRGGRDD